MDNSVEETQIMDINNQDSKEKALFDSIHEYEDDNIKVETRKSISYALESFVFICGLLIISLMLSISISLKNINLYLYYISLVVFLVLFIWFYVRPIVLIIKMDNFEIDREKDTSIIRRHNTKVRKNIAKKIVEFQKNVKKSNWYDQSCVDKINEALNKNDDGLIYKYLTELMNRSIYKASDRIIIKSAIQSGLYAAVSPSPNVDALLILSTNFKMIKDLVFLYGFRPTEPKLIRIAISVLFSSLAAYHLEGIKVGTVIGGKALSKSLPFLSGGAEYLTNAGIQAIINASITMWIGYKTIDYLKKEYKIQSLFENIELLDEKVELENTRKQIFDEIKIKIPFFKKKSVENE